MSKYSADDYRDAASSLRGYEGETEIDGNATVSMGDDDGAYVQAWVWVSDDQMRRLGYVESGTEEGEDEGAEGTDDQAAEAAADRADPEEHRPLAEHAQQAVLVLDVQSVTGEGHTGGADEVEGAEGGRQPGVTVEMVCSECGKPGILRDAWAEWDTDRQGWVLANTFENFFCPVCSNESSVNEVPLEEEKGV